MPKFTFQSVVALVQSKQSGPQNYTPEQIQAIHWAASQVGSTPDPTPDEQLLVEEASRLRQAEVGVDGLESFSVVDESFTSHVGVQNAVDLAAPSASPVSGTRRRPNRFVQDTLDGITIGGLSVEEYVKQNPVALQKAARLAAEGANDEQ
jgi:hypothetical protein